LPRLSARPLAQSRLSPLVPKPQKNVRRAAVSALRAWSKGHVYADSLVERHADRNHLSPPDRALLKAILMGVLRHRSLIDHSISTARKGKLDSETRDILRVGVCQLLVLKIPDHAAIYETVECARAPVRGLINAVLRRVAHYRARFVREMGELEPATQYSHPHWIYKRWKKLFGPKNTEVLMDWNNVPAETHLRPNLLSPPPADQPEPEDHIAAVESGHYYITDPSTARAPELLAPQPGETILDACAAPGGKAIQLAGLMESQGRLLCTDSNEKRLPRLNENLTRCRVTNAEVEVHDWTKPAPEKWHGLFDGILLDVPCSNTGVFRRRVDVRWRLKAQDIEDLTKIQTQILGNALPCLKPGGRIVYSTCSIDPEENLDLINNFIKEHPTLTLKDHHQLLPFQDDCDGAFAALLLDQSKA